MKIQEESGIFIILTSVVALSLLSGLILLGTNTYLIRAGSLELRTRAEEICSALIESDVFRSDQLMRSFADYVNSLPPTYPGGQTRITKAKLIIPSMPISDNFNSFNAGLGIDTYLNTTNLVNRDQNLTGIPFSNFGIQACSNPSLDAPDCLFQSNVNWITSIPRRFPEYLWNNIDNVQNTIGCEFEGKINLFLDPLSPRKIEGRVVYEKKTRGNFSQYKPYHLGDHSDFNKAVAPGLSIAISTHLTTKASEVKYAFPIPGSPTSWNSSNNSIWESIEGPERYDYSHNRPPFPASPYPAFSNQSLVRNTGDNVSGIPIMLDSPLVPTTSSDLNELLTTCSNPLILVRNAFLTSLIELASRNGELRAKTEFLNIATQDRNITSLTSLPANINGPSVIVPFGEDLLEQNYQAPYVKTFNTDVVPTLSSQLGNSLGGVLNPLSTNTNVSQRKIHSLIATQVRACHHLYWEENTPPPPPTLPAPIRLTRFQEGPEIWAAPNFFEPPYFLDKFTDKIRSPIPSPNWDQNCPWNSPTPTCLNPASQQLNASQVASFLGSTQICPFEYSGCAKPETNDPSGTFDLRPDYLGLLNYLTNSGVKAIKSPGLFGKNNPNNLIETSNSNTAIIIVTHLRLSAGEVDVLENEIANFPDRHITIVWFTADDGNLIQDGVDDFNRAFHISSDADPTGNQLFVFSPFYGESNIYKYQALAPEEQYTHFWMDMLNPNDPNYIVRKAILVYNSKLKSTVKF